jgi:type I restriction enzyme S subunit
MFLRDVKKGAEIKTKQMYVVRTGDIVISRMQVVHGAVAMVPPEFDGCNVSGTYLVLVPRSGAPIDPGFFEYLTQTPRMYHAAYTSSYGVHIEKMTFNPEWYLETPVLLPPTVAEQERIARVLDLCCSEVDLLAAQREQIEVMRRALLSRLLSGSLSVPV